MDHGSIFELRPAIDSHAQMLCPAGYSLHASYYELYDAAMNSSKDNDMIPRLL